MSPFFRIRSSSIRRPPRAAPAGQGPRAAGPPRPGRRRREGGLGAHADEEPTQSRGSGTASASAPAPAPRAPRDMECGAAPPPPAPAPAAAPPPPPPNAFRTRSPTERSPAKSGLHVNFSDKGEVKERREKFLTAKYGSHQMALIRKRLAVEMWLYDELQRLFAAPPRPAPAPQHPAPHHPAPDVDVDIDELLDMESDDQRRTHLAMLLADAKKPQKDVNNFINELLEKAKTL